MDGEKRANGSRRRGRVVTGLAVGIVVAGGAFVTAGGPASAKGDATVTIVVSSTASASADATAGRKATTKATATATTAAPPLTSSGRSVTLTAAQQPSQVGVLFSGSMNSKHYCTASVVSSPAGNVIVTAAHCLSSGATGQIFVPGYRNGTAPYGVWKISQVLEDDAWTSSQDPDHDVAFALVEPLNGESVQSVVGSYDLDATGVTATGVQITGYNSRSDEPISCSGTSETFTSTQLTVACTGYAGGTSGSGWVEDYDPTDGSGTLVGVIGGYETGGDTEDVSYAAVFSDDVAALYAQAQKAS